MTILLDDLGAFLDRSCPWELMSSRADLFQLLFSLILSNLGCSSITFRRSTEFHLGKDFILDFYRMASLVPEGPAFRVAQLSAKEHPSLAQLCRPLLYSLCEHYLAADVRVLGGEEAARLRGDFSAKFMESMGYRAALNGHHPLLSQLTGQGEMRGEGEAVLGLLDTAPEANKKLNKAFCEPKNVAVNPVLEIVRELLHDETAGE